MIKKILYFCITLTQSMGKLMISFFCWKNKWETISFTYRMNVMRGLRYKYLTDLDKNIVASNND